MKKGRAFFDEISLVMVVYIIYSNKLDGYYVGSTQDIDKRLHQHNRGFSKYTKKGSPWELVTTFDCSNRSEAVRLESKIKKRGIKRFLDDMNSS